MFIQYIQDEEQNVHLAFIHLRKSYDELYNAMAGINKLTTNIQAIKNLYIGNEILIMMGSRLITRIKPTKGQLQGCPSSPTLFKIFLKHVLVK